MPIINTDISDFEDSVFSIPETYSFNEAAIHLFHFQYQNNSVYRQYCDLLKVVPDKIMHYSEIPYLPVRFFKQYKIGCEKAPQFEPKEFTSSGTGGMKNSVHYVPDIRIYEKSFLKTFQIFYGQPEEYAILALLPSYLERQGSSLVYMVQKLMEQSKNANSGFYLHHDELLYEKLKYLESQKQKTILIGVSFALLDFAEKFKMKLDHTIIMETGGMKGRREEVTRDKLHEKLKRSFGVENIHSEYGMTELLSQAYSTGHGIFKTPPWMNIHLTSIHDPKEIMRDGKSGKVCITDLANIYSCAFIATDDIGKKISENEYEILGRLDESDLRGCSLMIS